MERLARIIKLPFYKALKYILNSNYFREQLWLSARDLFCQHNTSSLDHVHFLGAPDYGFLGKEGYTDDTSQSPVFITSRFRSGSTFVWQLFRAIEGVTAYYEPLNENQWFLQRENNFKTDPTHLGANDYSSEYIGLSYLKHSYRFHWTDRYLYMDKKHYDPELYNYIMGLIESANGRAVLQFNRIDFRLSWLRAYFPFAKILHMYRNPREQWISIQRDGGMVSPNLTIKKSNKFDLFYTIQWARDLCRVFPFLEPEKAEHPYELHYYLWRLSYIFGQNCADYSVSYEDLVLKFETTFATVLSHLGINGVDVSSLSHIVKGKLSNKWKDYASEKWYAEKEARCEKVLRAFFGQMFNR